MNRTVPITLIDESVEKHKCPEKSFCIVSTTGMSPHEREKTCLKCWLKYCKEKNIKIDYEGENDQC